MRVGFGGDKGLAKWWLSNDGMAVTKNGYLGLVSRILGKKMLWGEGEIREGYGVFWGRKCGKVRFREGEGEIPREGPRLKK
ncbi:hypothetical protein TIFTF001_045291 [Ficus carica]|uniref:Uncharacterized protein n=1 Tax=Ficus carica TaxID=3494 RepID=A0AA88CJP3_FICCA|nr:hypothetical protein TIFTF001_045283 [Ficus carica]GMN20125.1 hypothetical protein TIFTF001_045286 [Ficus carica]GMN20134.1 hypothetical protein TIFTF001_045288 [Ficus carica]GMN20143.1 hypothetical protein TIFTF001_045291 [Ficus carica]